MSENEVINLTRFDSNVSLYMFSPMGNIWYRTCIIYDMSKTNSDFAEF